MIRYLKIDCTLAKTDKLPLEFMGSALRGSFGIALKKISCINPSYICHQCFAEKNCLYYDFFEVKNKFHSYRFSKALADENFNFTLYLFEDSCEKLPYILSTLKEMLTVQGLGIEKTIFHMTSLMCNGVNVLDGYTFNINAVFPKEFDYTCDDITQNVTLILKTPLRIKSENKLLYSKPSLEQILTSIYHRVQGLKGIPLGELSFIPKYLERQGPHSPGRVLEERHSKASQASRTSPVNISPSAFSILGAMNNNPNKKIIVLILVILNVLSHELLKSTITGLKF